MHCSDLSLSSEVLKCRRFHTSMYLTTMNFRQILCKVYIFLAYQSCHSPLYGINIAIHYPQGQHVRVCSNVQQVAPHPIAHKLAIGITGHVKS